MYRHYSPYRRFSKQAEMDYSKMLSPFASEGANKALYAAGGGLLGAGAGALLSKLFGGSALKGGLVGGGLGAGAGYFGRGALQDYLKSMTPAAGPFAGPDDGSYDRVENMRAQRGVKQDTVTDSARMNALRGSGLSQEVEREDKAGPFAGPDDGSYDRVENMRAQRGVNENARLNDKARLTELVNELGERAFQEEQARVAKGLTPETEAERALAEEQGRKFQAERAARLADPNSPENRRAAALSAIRQEFAGLQEEEAKIREVIQTATRVGNSAVADQFTERLADIQRQYQELNARRRAANR